MKNGYKEYIMGLSYSNLHLQVNLPQSSSALSLFHCLVLSFVACLCLCLSLPSPVFLCLPALLSDSLESAIV